MPSPANKSSSKSRWLIDIEPDRALGNVLQVTRAEVDTFRLNPFLVDELAGDYERYLDYLGAFKPAIDPEKRNRDRTDYPGYGCALLDTHPILLSDLVVKFMVDVCGVSGEQATRFDLKVRAAEHRLGVVVATRPVTLN